MHSALRTLSRRSMIFYHRCLFEINTKEPLCVLMTPPLHTDVRCVPSLFLPVTSVYAELELISYKLTLCYVVKYVLCIMYGIYSALCPLQGMQNLQLIQYHFLVSVF